MSQSQKPTTTPEKAAAIKEYAESGEVVIRGIDSEGKERDMSVLEENDVAFDPGRMTMDLNKAEKRRTTALMMAIQAYNNIIIKDAEMYIAIERTARTGEGPKIRPATMSAMVHAAIQFDAFISGRFDVQAAPLGPDDDLEGVPEDEEAAEAPTEVKA